MNKYNNFFKDSYGLDKLSKYLLVIGVVFLINRITLIPGVLIIVYAGWRAISKNKYKRYEELQGFNRIFQIIGQKFYRLKYKFGEHRQYKVFKCPNCSQKLRVPRKKGKITITCKKCGEQFKGRT